MRRQPSILWSRELAGISLVYLVEGVSDMNFLAVQTFLKDTLKLEPATAGLVLTLVSLPYQVTPLLGLISDTIPILGYRRKGYLIVVGILGSLCWSVLPLTRSIGAAALALGLANTCVMWSQVIADSVMVGMCQGKSQEVASLYQSLSWAAYTAGAVISATVGSMLLNKYGTSLAFRMVSIGLLLDALCASAIREQHHDGDHLGHESSKGLSTYFSEEGDPGLLLQPSSDLSLGLMIDALNDNKVYDDHAVQSSHKNSSRDSSLPQYAMVKHSLWLDNMRRLISTVLKTFRQPQIFYPILFVFIWQSTPSASNALFYWQTEVLKFDTAFLEMVQLTSYLAAFAGLAVYQIFLAHSSLYTLLLGCSLVGIAFNATLLLLVTRLNEELGIPDKAFILGDYTMMSVLSKVMMTPVLALVSRTCPEGAEATLYSCMWMVLSWSNAIATTLGSGLTYILGITSENFSNLPILVLVCNLSMLLPLPLLCLLPSSCCRHQSTTRI